MRAQIERAPQTGRPAGSSLKMLGVLAPDLVVRSQSGGHAGRAGRGVDRARCVGDLPGVDPAGQRLRITGRAPRITVPGGDVRRYVSLVQRAAVHAAPGAGRRRGAAWPVGLRDGPGTALRPAMEGRLRAGPAGYGLRPVAADALPAPPAAFNGTGPAVQQGQGGRGGHRRTQGETSASPGLDRLRGRGGHPGHRHPAEGLLRWHIRRSASCRRCTASRRRICWQVAGRGGRPHQNDTSAGHRRCRGGRRRWWGPAGRRRGSRAPADRAAPPLRRNGGHRVGRGESRGYLETALPQPWAMSSLA